MEYLFCLCTGSVDFSWNGNSHSAQRRSWIEEEPTVLSVPENTDVELFCPEGAAEINYACTDNDRDFTPRLITPGNLLFSAVVDADKLDGKTKRAKRAFYDWDSHPDSCLFCGSYSHQFFAYARAHLEGVYGSKFVIRVSYEIYSSPEDRSLPNRSEDSDLMNDAYRNVRAQFSKHQNLLKPPYSIEIRY